MFYVLTILALVGAPSTAMTGPSFAAFEGVYRGALDFTHASALRPGQAPSEPTTEADKLFSVSFSVRRLHGAWIAYDQGHVLCMLTSGWASPEKMVQSVMHKGPRPQVANCMFQGPEGVEQIDLDTSEAEAEARAERFVFKATLPANQQGQRLHYIGTLQHRSFTWTEKIRILFEG